MLNPARSLAGSPETHQIIVESGGLGALVRVLQAKTPAAMQAGAEACRCVRSRCSLPGTRTPVISGDLHSRIKRTDNPRQLRAHLVHVRHVPSALHPCRPSAVIISLAAIVDCGA